MQFFFQGGDFLQKKPHFQGPEGQEVPANFVLGVQTHEGAKDRQDVQHFLGPALDFEENQLEEEEH